MSPHDVALFPREGGGWRLLVGGVDLAGHVDGITVEVDRGGPPVVTLVLRADVDLDLPGSDVRLEPPDRGHRDWESRPDVMVGEFDEQEWEESKAVHAHVARRMREFAEERLPGTVSRHRPGPWVWGEDSDGNRVRIQTEAGP